MENNNSEINNMNGVIEVDSIEDIEDMLERINAFIVPSIARTQLEKAAVRKAAVKQLLYEKNLKSNFGNKEIPNNVSSFRIGNFSMSFNNNNGNSKLLNKNNISPVAYSILFNAGLLYRGLNS